LPTSSSILRHPSLVATSVSPVTHGFVALMRSVALQVCHFWMVSSNCTPGSAHTQAASAMSCHSFRAWNVSYTAPVVRSRVCHVPSFSTASMNASGMRTLLFEFCPATVAYASPLKSDE
jgi:hypothetical protein